MAKAIRFHATGGPEVLSYDEITIPKTAKGEILVRHSAIGVNFIDVYFRTGLYKLPSLPSGIGMEGAGVVEAVGEGVSGFKTGDRVAHCSGLLGAYSEYHIMPARWLVKIPDTVSNELAAALMVKGLTAHYLLRRSFKVEAGQKVLIHAAAGGVGLIACQFAKHLGATVIGTVGSEEKAAIAKAHGCDHTVLYNKDKVSEKVKEMTGGQGVDVVYDSVGKTTFMDSLDCVKRLGMVVSFGQASGPIPPFDLSILQQKGSLFLTRPSLMHYINDEDYYKTASQELLDLVGQGVIRVHVGQEYALSDATQAHIDLESRKTTGAIVLKT